MISSKTNLPRCTDAKFHLDRPSGFIDIVKNVNVGFEVRIQKE